MSMSKVTYDAIQVTFYIYVKCQMSNAYVDPWDMVTNFCFHMYAQKSLFIVIGENANVLSFQVFNFQVFKNIQTFFSSNSKV